jgi:SAM-dependent methyltransferase
MIRGRNITNKINWVLDNVVPPVLRDSRLFMGLGFYALFGGKAKYFLEFKEKAPLLTREEYEEYYAILSDKHIKRETDLNKKCLQRILDAVVGESVLDVGCGNGYLLKKIALEKKIKAVGVDMVVPEELKSLENPSFIQQNIEKLPFGSQSFDTVVCTHTIEHLLNPETAIREIRRVAREKIILVVPRQREYKYTFDLHVNFFPYVFSLRRIMRNSKAECFLMDNDIYYEEDVER